MSVPVAAVELTWTFDLNQNGPKQDIAEFSLWLHNGSGATTPQSDLDFLAQNGADSWSSRVSKSHYAATVSLRSCTARTFLANGHTLAESIKVPATAWVGGSGEPCLPWETSLCISLYAYQPGTFVVNGKRKRGRYYLPPMSTNVMAQDYSGFMDNTIFLAILNEQNSFQQGCVDGSGGPLIVTLAVFSRVDSDLYPVLYVVGDAKIDSQRRRQNRETAGRVSIPTG